MSEDYAILRSVGLSKAAVQCYESLFKDGSATVSELAERLAKSRTGLYRVLRSLVAKGFVDCLKTEIGPTYCSAVPVGRAWRDYADRQQKQLSQLIRRQTEELARRSGMG